MEQLHRDTTKWENQEKLKNERYVYGGQDELTGEYCDQLFPINDYMCMRCAQKHRDKSFVRKATVMQRTGLCMFCGTFYDFSSNFLQITFYAGRNTIKRYSRLDQYNNTKSAQENAVKKTERKIEELSRRFR